MSLILIVHTIRMFYSVHNNLSILKVLDRSIYIYIYMLGSNHRQCSKINNIIFN